jgi:hypothetical protein
MEHQEQPKFVRLAEVAAEIGIDVKALGKRARREGIQLFRGGEDRRQRWVTGDDAARLRQPQPIGDARHLRGTA